MAVQTISYTNKVDLNTTSVADINKVNASDLNEIKTVVNNNASDLSGIETFSTTEQVIGTWHNSKPIYRKVLTGISVSASGQKYISMGVSVDEYINVYGFAHNTVQTGLYDPIPSINIADQNYNISLRVFTNTHASYPNNIRILTGSSAGLDNGYLVVEYTKAS